MGIPCTLHIGTEKTATTSLQAFLDLNREKLLEDGAFFPKGAGTRNNIRLVLACYNDDRRDYFTRTRRLTSRSDFVRFRSDLVHALRDELKTAIDGNSIEKVIFSSEHIQSRLTSPIELERLRSLLEELGLVVTSVVVYLRNPPELAASLYSTQIKSGSLEASPPAPGDPYVSNVCDHKATINRFSEIFGEETVTPRLFERSSLTNGSIFDDFIEAVGIPSRGDYDYPEYLNEGLSSLGIEILRRLNESIPLMNGNDRNPVRADLVSYVTRNFNDDRYHLPRTMATRYETEFQASNEWVRAKYFPERDRLFRDGYRSSNAAIMMSSANLDRVAGLLSDIWQEKQGYIRVLKNRLRESRQPGSIRGIIRKFLGHALSSIRVAHDRVRDFASVMFNNVRSW